MPTENGPGRVTWWLIGLVAAFVVLLVGSVASGHAIDLREIKARVTVLERESAANERSRQEMQRQMILVQEKLDQISERIRRLY